MKILATKRFNNGVVYALEVDGGYPIETTDTFLPYYTKFCVNSQNTLHDYNVGCRQERWMIGVSVMSGCPVGCKFCATASLKKWRSLTADEIVAQVVFVLKQNPNIDPSQCKEFKINYTRMGEPFLNIDNVKEAIRRITLMFPNTHHYVSTIGIKGMDTSWIKGNITLQLSLHSLDEAHRDELIPFTKKMTIAELGQVRTQSNLQTTLNMTLVNEDDFDIDKLKASFNPEHFFVKLSPINVNDVSRANNLGAGVIDSENLA